MKFIASQNLDLINEKGKEVKVLKGEVVPKEFRRLFLEKNRNFLADLEYENGIPKISKEEEKEYKISFGIKPEDKTMKGKIKGRKYTREKLTRRLNKYGDKDFKTWAEKEFGVDEIDKRRSSNSIINQILKLQGAAKR